MNDAVDGFDNDGMQFFQTVRFFGKHDTADDILAIADLAVEIAGFRNDFTGDEVDELAVDGGGADIDGDGVIGFGRISGLHIDNVGFSAFLNRSFKGCGHLETTFPQNIRYLTDNRQADRQAVFALIQFEKTDQSRYIRETVIRRRFRQFDVFFFNRRHKQTLLFQIVEVHLFDFCRLPGGYAHIQDTGIDRGFDGYADGEITFDQALTGDPVAFVDVLLTQSFADAAGYVAVFDNDTAFSADTLSTAGSVDVNTGFQSPPEDGLALGNVDGNVVGLE